jgi:hypothetical protein
MSDPMSERLEEIARVLGPDEVVPIETAEWELSGGEHDGMDLAEYIRRFNKPTASPVRVEEPE